MSISKSQYLKGLQCHKRLWLSKHKPELAKPVSNSQQFIFDQGIEVGKLAQKLFSGGTEIEYDPSNFPALISKTKDLLEINHEVTIYEASFNYSGSFAMIDILVKTANGLEVYEVKSGTKAKEVNINDLAFQVYILKGLGYKISKASLVYINNQYVRGPELDISELFTIEDLTEGMTQLIEPIEFQVKEMSNALQNKEPDIDIGPYCKKPYECEFKDHCWSHVPEVSVFNLANARGKDWELYYNGVIKLEDVPLSPQISSKHQEQIQTYLSKSINVEKKAINKFLATIEYPISFLDFETYQEAIPSHPGMRSYEQIPFQFSLHVLKSENSELDHVEFLAEPGLDPREAFITRLMQSLPQQGNIVVYNQSFEAGVMRKMAKLYPDHEEQIEAAICRFVDLMQVFKARWYYHWQFQGSYSIKKVLPALVPELSYADLDIAEGASAARSYSELLNSNEEKAEQVKQNLLEYCRLDTLAMVEIWKVLKDIINEHS
jgi:CRISPR/Cas system-associated exonuclease Cas4 (RecB family)